MPQLLTGEDPPNAIMGTPSAQAWATPVNRLVVAGPEAYTDSRAVSLPRIGVGHHCRSLFVTNVDATNTFAHGRRFCGHRLECHP